MVRVSIVLCLNFYIIIEEKKTLSSYLEERILF